MAKRDEITVNVFDYKRTGRLYLRAYIPGLTRRPERSANTTNWREAERQAALWQQELDAGKLDNRRMSWAQFRRFYEEHKAPNVALSTRKNDATALDAFERLTPVRSLRELTTARITAYKTALTNERGPDGELRRDLMSVRRSMSHLRAIVNWAHKQDLIDHPPAFDMPKVPDRMKGRPLTEDEIDAILAAVPRVIQREAAVERGAVGACQQLITGMFLTGLRAGEALALRWDHQPGGVSIRLDDDDAFLVFDGEAQKNRMAQVAPVSPDAASFFETYRQSEGFVFNVQRRDGKGVTRNKTTVERLLRDVGREAGVMVDDKLGKFASAHDFRRTFGNSWKHLGPDALRQAMRHGSEATTRKYYQLDRAAEVNDAMRNAKCRPTAALMAALDENS